MKTMTASSFAKSLPPASIETLVARKPFATAMPKVVGRLSAAPVAHLTPRQLEVLTLLCEGMTNKHISRKLGISNATVKIHISCILRALEVTNRLQAVIAARRLGLIDGQSAFANITPPQGAPELRQPFTLRIVWDSISAQWRAATADEPLIAALA